ncbi:leucine-rich repeat-containing protein 15-like [Diachasmimorpha longicaudata]|uniref:leucine-rich repeat-containing protein 15-like n=1 Tax=Diachasmimorpha longicaudata TaxID=58733 RepID=UPI0030B86A04
MGTIIEIVLICLTLSLCVESDKNDKNAIESACCALKISNALRLTCVADLNLPPNILQDYGTDIQNLEVNFYSQSESIFLSLHLESIADFKNLTSLAIQRADISFTRKYVVPIDSLKDLKLLHCAFNEVPTKLLKSSRNLENLSLEKNRIRIIEPSAFNSLKHLKDLNLSWNRIHILTPDCFEGLNKLEKLNLSYNDFTAMPGIFYGLNQLKTLDLTRALLPKGHQDRNPKDPVFLEDITVLVPGLFDDTPQLHYLRLDRNPIKNIAKGVFNNLRFLKELSITISSVATIEPGAFSGLNLAKLDLSGTPTETIMFEVLSAGQVGGLLPIRNHISKIQPRTFDKLSVLTLNMSFNFLSVIGDEDFYGLEVGELILSGNGIIKIAPDAFKSTKVKKIKIGSRLAVSVDKKQLGLREVVTLEK